MKVSTAHTHFTMFYYSVTVGYEKRSTKITVEREDTVTDVIIAACNALDVPFDANMNLQTKITGQWRYVHTHRLKEIVWSREGLRIWRSKTPLDVKIHNVMVYEGSWGAQARNIQADADNPIKSVGGSGIIIDGGGHIITGKEGSFDGQFIKFDSSDTTDLIIQNVKLNGFGNVSNIRIYGGVIFNEESFLSNISSDFTNNIAITTDAKHAKGGEIYN